MTNPFFITGVVPEPYFCDREKETDKIITYIRNKSNVLLTSSRRMGKTQLLRHIFNDERIKQDYHSFYVDIYATSSLQEMVFFLGKAIYREMVPGEKKALKLFLGTIKSLAAAFSVNPVTGEPQVNLQIGDIAHPALSLEEIFSYLEIADKPCIVAIDEFQQISRYPEKNVEALLRTHIQRLNNCNFIFSGSDRHILEQMFSSYSKPFYNSAQPLHLGSIERQKYTEFVVNNFSSAEIDISPDSVKACYDLFDGHTFYNHKIFHEVFASARPGTTVDEAMIQKTIAEILEENSHTYSEVMASLSMPLKQMFIAVAKEGTAKHPTSGAFVKKHALISPSSAQKAVAKLLEDQLITYSIQNGEKEYSLTDKFLELWIRKTY